MIQSIFSYIERFSSLSDERKAALEEILRQRHFPKKTIVIHEGEVADSIFFISRGTLRSYLLKDGDDITDYFFFEENFASDFASLYTQKPSRFYLESLEDTDAFQIRREDLLMLGQKDPFFESLGRVTAEMAFVEIEERMHLLQHAKLEDKFRWMMRKFPQVFQRVPQYHIASYLGVKPESLSRIKKNLGSSY